MTLQELLEEKKFIEEQIEYMEKALSDYRRELIRINGLLTANSGVSGQTGGA